MRTKGRAAQHVTQLRRLAERIRRLERQFLDVDVRLEKAVEQHNALRTAGQQRVARREYVRQAHRQLHRHRNRNRRTHLAHDVRIVLLNLRGRSPAVGRKQEDVQFQRRSPGGLHRRRIVDPRIARTHAVDAPDHRNARLRGIGDELQQLGLVGVAQVAFEILARIAVTLHLVQRSRLAVDLLLEDRLQHHGSRTRTDARLDMGEGRRIGRTAHDHGTRQFQPQIFGFHDFAYLVR